jgi:protein SCO1/2
MSNLKRVQAAFADNNHLLLLSPTLAPWHDSSDTLRAYGQNMGILYPQWRLLTGNKDLIYQLSAESCHIGGMQTPTAPGGIDHSPYAALFDKTGLLRGLYIATDPAEVDKLIEHAEELME